MQKENKNWLCGVWGALLIWAISSISIPTALAGMASDSADEPGRVIVNEQVIDLVSGEKVGDALGLRVSRNSNIYAVAGADGAYLFSRYSLFDRSLKNSGIVSEKRFSVGLRFSGEKRKKQSDEFAFLKDKFYVVADDLRRVCWFQNGDLWRGELDWNTTTVINLKQVTDIGVFYDRSSPFLWAGNHVFLYGKFDPQKPIVRINLNSGEYEEIDWFKTKPTLVNPNETIAVFVTPELIRLVDLQDGRTVVINNKYKYGSNKEGSYITPEKKRVSMDSGRVLKRGYWKGDSIFISLSGGHEGGVVVLDTRLGQIFSLSPVFENKDSIVVVSKSITRYAFLEDESIYIDMTVRFQDTSMGQSYKGRSQKDRSYLIDPLLHTVVPVKKYPIPVAYEQSAEILKSGLVLIGKRQSGLSGNGVYLFNPKDGSENLVSKGLAEKLLYGLTFSDDGKYLLYDKKGTALFRYSIESGETIKIAESDDKSRLDWAILRRPEIDLGIGSGSKSLWDIVVPAAPLATSAAESTLPTTGFAEGLAVIEKIYENSSDEVQHFSLAAYQFIISHDELERFIDPVRGVERLLDAREHYDNVLDWSTIYYRVDFSQAVDRQRVFNYSFHHVTHKTASVENIESAAQDTKVTVECFSQKLYDYLTEDFSSFHQGGESRVSSKLMKICQNEISESKKTNAENSQEVDSAHEIQEKAKKDMKNIFGIGG